MASVTKSSSSYNLSISSDSENEIRSNIKHDPAKIDFTKTFNTGLASSLSRQTTNNSIRYFKKLKRKKPIYESDSSFLSYKLNPSKNKYNLSDLKNVSNYKKKRHGLKNKNIAYPSSIDLNKEFAYAFESSSDSDFPDIKYLRTISKNKEINTSSVSMESKQNESYSNLTNKKRPTLINISNIAENINNNLESSMSSDITDFGFSRMKTNSVNLQQKDVYINNELNLDQILSDCSLSDVLFVSKDNSDLKSQFYPTPGTDNSVIQIKTPLNISLDICDELLTQHPSNNINVPDLIENEATEVEQTETIDEIDIFKPKLKLNHKDSDSNKPKSISKQRSNSQLSIEKSVISEPVCNHCNRSNKIKKTIHTKIRNTKQSKSKRSQKDKPLGTTSDILRIKKSCDKKKTKNCVKTNETVEDIGLEYDTGKDNYMVELPNGALVPVFLSTLKPKHVKKLCACGITLSDIPLYWSQSFHDILHQNIYKLRFNGDILDDDIVNIKQNDLFFKILILCKNYYNNENIKKSIKDVNDYVCLEYGISNTSNQSDKYSTYLAVLPNFKVIGYLEIEPIQKAYKLINAEQYSENIIETAKYGVSKIWTFIKYRHKNIDINLLETFCKKKNLQKKDLAFSLYGCQGIQFIQQYTGNKNILIYS
ncbi:protein PF14_0175-like [Melanaphis sacchari]|uniref:protein PF14_0175-like n=1 Tax=Melanaphis sacchari TaxID=742174 RepID=UPI000DC134D1|nr:protein PF14_0175-like [Melanaphis sacchari]